MDSPCRKGILRYENDILPYGEPLFALANVLLSHKAARSKITATRSVDVACYVRVCHGRPSFEPRTPEERAGVYKRTSRMQPLIEQATCRRAKRHCRCCNLTAGDDDDALEQTFVCSAAP